VILNQYRPVANICALFIGPAILFVLFVVDTVHKVQAGKLSWGDVPKYTLDSILRTNPSARPVLSPPPGRPSS